MHRKFSAKETYVHKYLIDLLISVAIHAQCVVQSRARCPYGPAVLALVELILIAQAAWPTATTQQVAIASVCARCSVNCTASSIEILGLESSSEHILVGVRLEIGSNEEANLAVDRRE